jgi:hypothetical protein
VKRAFSWSRRPDEGGVVAVEAALITRILVFFPVVTGVLDG